MGKEGCGDSDRWDSECHCFPCYHGKYCNYVVRSLCHGTVEAIGPVKYFYACKCNYNQSGHCCETKKCAGSNPTPDLETGKCNCSEPELRSGELCEKVKCSNGITRVKDGDCDCAGTLFTGEYCQRIKCLNRGFSYANATKCHCRGEGRFYGTHCELVKCDNGGTQLSSTFKCVDCGFFHRGDYCHEIYTPHLFLVLVPLVCLLICILYWIRKKRKNNALPKETSPARGPPNASRTAACDRSPQITTTTRFWNPTSIHRSSSERLARPHRQSEQGLGDHLTRDPGNDPYANDQLSSSRFLDSDLPNYPANEIGSTPQDRPLTYEDDPPPYELVVKMNAEGDVV